MKKHPVFLILVFSFLSLHCLLIFSYQEVLAASMVNKVPWKYLVKTPLAIYIEIGVDVDIFESVGPVAVIFMYGQEDFTHLPVTH